MLLFVIGISGVLRNIQNTSEAGFDKVLRNIQAESRAFVSNKKVENDSFAQLITYIFTLLCVLTSSPF